MDREITIEGIRVVVRGECRRAFDIARDFVQEQSQGEWGDDQIDEDAVKLARLMLGFAEGSALAKQTGE